MSISANFFLEDCSFFWASFIFLLVSLASSAFFFSSFALTPVLIFGTDTHIYTGKS
jgi:hypothetical protein